MAGPLLTSPAVDPNPTRFFQHVERTEYVRFSTIPFFHSPSSSKYWPAPQLPSLFRRCNETTIHLWTITIPLGDYSKVWECVKSAGEDVRL
ncbi:hypothetical protein DPMN_126538 [Dreissena polymorpha]|uniref:Uncharacterized protein n=1 Tax=Dreissena polymorpha TaxID=45954 RepID=A0A9D4JY81_DREPO|nr:hypothetical protein DPMN_126538 [Dreissena polymorpha]